MITKVVHGWRVGGLIAYLMGPGRAEEHRSPRVIASWDGRDVGWQPAASGPGEWDLELGPLIRALRAPVVAAGLPDRADEGGKRGYVWHCSARVAAGDRTLSDAEWASVVRELLDGAGVARRGDAGGPRWVAIRHADDHVHIAVVLVRQDTARRFWPHHDFPRLRQAAGEIERRLGLTVTAAADGTAARAPGRGELEKAARQGREPARLELARAVRAAAVAAEGLPGFVAALEGAGLLVEVRRAPSGDPLGYKVARRGDVGAGGDPIFYSGSRLAPDLSLPRLLRVWAAADGGPEVAGPPLEVARRRVVAARAAVAAARGGRGGEDPGGIAHAARDVLTAVGGRSGELAAAADVFDRAARPPRGTDPRSGSTAAGLRRVARRLVRLRRLAAPGDDPGAAVVALAVALTALLREIAAWQADRARHYQAAAARAAADAVNRWAAHAAASPAGGPARRSAVAPTLDAAGPAARRVEGRRA